MMQMIPFPRNIKNFEPSFRAEIESLYESYENPAELEETSDHLTKMEYLNLPLNCATIQLRLTPSVAHVWRQPK